MLVTRGADIFDRNDTKETACDIAMKKNCDTIAKYLELKMLFSVSLYI